MPEPADLAARLARALGNQYRVERELGGGGMSRVFLAHDTALDRAVVVKVLAEHLASGVNVQRFNREVLLAAGLQHPHIVGVLSAGVVDGLPFFIMPFVDGESLRKHLDEGPPPVAGTVSILQDVARGLAYAHRRGIIHRDVKPDNVMLSHGAAALTDFGIAKALHDARDAARPEAATLTQEGASLGTPTYMAPEQVAGEAAVDHRADLYALGVMAYEMLAGKPPFHGRSVTGVLAAHLTERPPPLAREGVPAGLRDLVMACLEKDPDRRPQTADALVEALDAPAVRSGPWKTTTRPGRIRNAAVGIVTVIVLGVGAALLLRPGAARSDVVEKSIAVLPLVNVGGDTTDAYFADGMTDELITALQSVPGLRVASRTAVFAYKGRSVSPEDIARALNVSTLLEGTVRRAGDRLRLTAQLVDATDGFTSWSETYETEMRDVFAVQDSIARAIVAALRERFGDRTMAVETRRGTDDLEAYDQYLRGRYYFAMRGDAALRQAIAFFETAVARDAAFAAAWAGLADAWGLLPLYADVAPDSVLPRALAAADRAIAIDPTLAAAYASRGNLHQVNWQWPDAERDYRRAIALDAEYATARQWHGELLLLLGRADSAVAELARALALDPVSPVITGSFAGALGVAGLADSARRTARRARELGPDAAVTRMFEAAVLLYDGRDAAAADVLEPVAGRGGPATLDGLLGFAYARAGRPAEARVVLERLRANEERAWHATQIARIHLGLGRIDSALTWLERGVERHDPMFGAESLWSPLWAPLHEEPRFTALLRRMNLSPAR